MQTKDRIIEDNIFLESENFIIYGAGVYGKRVYYSLKNLGKHISAFLVSEIKENDPKDIDGITIYEALKVPQNILKNSKILVAVSEKYSSEIRERIEKNKLDILIDDVYFLDEADVSKLYRESFPVVPKEIFKTITPISSEWGFDRGTPIDRYFIERFLKKESEQLQQVELTLEVGDDEYSRRFFPNSRHEILNYSAGMDLTKDGTIPEKKYDVFICTQTFHQIYEIKEAIVGSYKLLKYGGVMLATVCGTIVKQARNNEYKHFWGFTPLAIERLMKEVYGENVIVEPFGNAMVATAFVQGLAVEELDMELVNQIDDDYTICISIVAKKICE